MYKRNTDDKVSFSLKATLTSLTAAPGRQYCGKRHPSPAGALANIYQEPLSVQSSLQLELGTGSRHRHSSPRQPSRTMCPFSVWHHWEEKITSKSFLAVSKIKPGLVHKAQQMSCHQLPPTIYGDGQKQHNKVRHLTWNPSTPAWLVALQTEPWALIPPASHWEFNMVYYHPSIIYYSTYNQGEGLFFSDSKSTPQNWRKSLFWLVIWLNLTRREQKGKRTKGHFYDIKKKKKETTKPK